MIVHCKATSGYPLQPIANAVCPNSMKRFTDIFLETEILVVK